MYLACLDDTEYYDVLIFGMSKNRLTIHRSKLKWRTYNLMACDVTLMGEIFPLWRTFSNRIATDNQPQFNSNPHMTKI